jgi:hypothetical protein
MQTSMAMSHEHASSGMLNITEQSSKQKTPHPAQRKVNPY